MPFTFFIPKEFRAATGDETQITVLDNYHGAASKTMSDTFGFPLDTVESWSASSTAKGTPIDVAVQKLQPSTNWLGQTIGKHIGPVAKAVGKGVGALGRAHLEEAGFTDFANRMERPNYYPQYPGTPDNTLAAVGQQPSFSPLGVSPQEAPFRDTTLPSRTVSPDAAASYDPSSDYEAPFKAKLDNFSGVYDYEFPFRDTTLPSRTVSPNVPSSWDPNYDPEAPFRETTLPTRFSPDAAASWDPNYDPEAPFRDTTLPHYAPPGYIDSSGRTYPTGPMPYSGFAGDQSLTVPMPSGFADNQSPTVPMPSADAARSWDSNYDPEAFFRDPSVYKQQQPGYGSTDAAALEKFDKFGGVDDGPSGVGIDPSVVASYKQQQPGFGNTEAAGLANAAAGLNTDDGMGSAGNLYGQKGGVGGFNPEQPFGGVQVQPQLGNTSRDWINDPTLREAGQRLAFRNVFGDHAATGVGPLAGYMQRQVDPLSSAFQASGWANRARELGGEVAPQTSFEDFLRTTQQQPTGLQGTYGQSLQDVNYLRGLGGSEIPKGLEGVFSPEQAANTRDARNLLQAAQRGKYSGLVSRAFRRPSEQDLFSDYVIAKRDATAGGTVPQNFFNFAASRYGL